MANLYSGTIASNGRYLDLGEETGLTFQSGHDYQIQFFNKGYIREGETGKGFYICDAAPFTLSFKGDTVYVYSVGNLEINIAD